ncbi:hypothetical protein SLE2022_343270 [Rubroshorea leprosula]
MAVEARHLNLFSPQLLGNREMMNPIEANVGFYNTQMGYGAPLSVATEALLPFYGSVVADSIPNKAAAIKSESTLTYNIPVSRKRPRDSFSPLLSFPSLPLPQSNTKASTPFSFLGNDISLQIQQQQLDIDCLISQHMEKVRIEIEEKRKRQARRIMDALEEGMMKKLRAKEEEIEEIGKLNWELEERVKSLCIENQIWRDLAQTNEATANALRTNLEQVLAAQVVKEERTSVDEAVVDDAQSCCGSSWEEERRSVAGEGGERKLVKDKDGAAAAAAGEGTSRVCRNCRKEESCVLLLPCRHLCLCTVCGSSLHVCPVCKSTKTASVHINMS